MADSGWGAGAIGAFGAMIGSVVGAGIASAALQSKRFRHVSSDHRQRALLLTTAGTGVVGALASVKLALDNGVGCPPCPAGTTRQLPASSTAPSPTPGTPVPASTANSWEGGATAAFGAIVGGVIAGAGTAAALSSKQFRRTSSGNRQRSLVLASAGGTVLGALFGGKAAADLGMGCGTCAPSGPAPTLTPTPVTPPTLPAPTVIPPVIPTPTVMPAEGGGGGIT
jgi:hypothetical protein